MPRKKKPIPPLDEVFKLSDGSLLVIGSVEAHAFRDHPNGRGINKVITADHKRDALLEHVFNDYFEITTKAGDVTNSGGYRPPRGNDYLKNASTFAEHMQTQEAFAGEDPDNPPDPSSLRKRHYPEVKETVNTLRNALEEESTSHETTWSCEPILHRGIMSLR